MDRKRQETKNQPFRLHTYCVAVNLLLVVLALASLATNETLAVQRGAWNPDMGQTFGADIERTEIVTSTVAYIPFVGNGVYQPRIKMGADVGNLTLDPEVIEYDYEIFRNMGANWTRVWLSWADVETEPGKYDWSQYDTLFAKLNMLGIKSNVILFHPPDWVYDQDSQLKNCGPIDDNSALEDFTRQLVTRYRDDVSAWEFINEPDGRQPHEYGPVIGCWGNHPAKYAAQLGIFSEQVNAIDPGSLVLFGGLAFDNWEHFERAFFAEALDAGAGAYFDVLSFHYYPINPDEFADVSHKIDELQRIMSEGNIQDKRIWITETSMWVNQDGSVERQREFILKEFSRAYCSGVDNVFWFAIRQEYENPPLHRWLVSLSHEPVNAYNTFSAYADTLADAYCETAVETSSRVEIYRFNVHGQPLYVAWSNNGPMTVDLPATGDAELLDWTGTVIGVVEPDSAVLTVDVSSEPIFVRVLE